MTKATRSSGPRWIVGLGNPGGRYERSRHNAGFWVVDRFAREHGISGEKRKFRALYSEGSIDVGAGEPVRVVLVKPQTYMNLSGPAVRDLLAYHAVPLDEDLKDRLLVVQDDLDLPAGKLRFRPNGSAGGHRGTASILSSLGHDRFGRLKVGIGRPEGVEAADYVLEEIDSATRAILERATERAASTLPVWLAKGIEDCMNRFNASVPEAGTGARPGDV